MLCSVERRDVRRMPSPAPALLLAGLVLVLCCFTVPALTDSAAPSVRSARQTPGVTPTCRVCRGKPRVCSCYTYRRINGRSRCSYNKKVPCPGPGPGSDDPQSKGSSRKVDRAVFVNKTLEEVCGRVHTGAQPRSLGGRQGRIINGTKARYGGWPWQVSLTQWNKLKGSYLHKCGATLVTAGWVLTAGHCVYKENYKEFELIMGEYDMYDYREKYPEQKSKLKRLIVHPKFDAISFENDLALLELTDPVQYEVNVVPACLPGQAADHLVGQRGWVTGWGITRVGGSLSPVLQEVEVPILSNSECMRLYRLSGTPQYVPLIFLCAGYREGGRDSCDGDSGGPLSVQHADSLRWEVAGVVSWGVGCGVRYQPGVMVRVAEYTTWIRNYVI